jgi:hypothetical protein
MLAMTFWNWTRKSISAGIFTDETAECDRELTGRIAEAIGTETRKAVALVAAYPRARRGLLATSHVACREKAQLKRREEVCSWMSISKGSAGTSIVSIIAV